MSIVVNGVTLELPADDSVAQKVPLYNAAFAALATDVSTIYAAARVYNNANISITNITSTALTFNSERRDDGTVHSTSTNTDRLTAPVTGWYLITGSVEFASNATGFRAVSIRLNVGATSIAGSSPNAVNGDTTLVSVSTLYYLTAADYVRLFVYQNSGGSLNVLSTGNYSPEFSLALIK